MKSLKSFKMVSLVTLAAALWAPVSGFAVTTWDLGALCGPDGSIVTQCTSGSPVMTGLSTATSTTTGSTTTFVQASIYDWGASSGLGVVNRYENSGDTGPHATDNKYGTDAILFNFGADKVKLTSLTIGWNGTDNATGTYNDSDLSVFAWTGAGAPTTGTVSASNANLSTSTLAMNSGNSNLLNSGWTLIGNYADVGGNAGNTQALGGSTYSSYWLVSAYNTNYGNVNANTACISSCTGLSDFNDQFKFLAVSADYKVPEPSGFALLALALLAMLATRRNWVNNSTARTVLPA